MSGKGQNPHVRVTRDSADPSLLNLLDQVSEHKATLGLKTGDSLKEIRESAYLDQLTTEVNAELPSGLQYSRKSITLALQSATVLLQSATSLIFTEQSDIKNLACGAEHGVLASDTPWYEPAQVEVPYQYNWTVSGKDALVLAANALADDGEAFALIHIRRSQTPCLIGPDSERYSFTDLPRSVERFKGWREMLDLEAQHKSGIDPAHQSTEDLHSARKATNTKSLNLRIKECLRKLSEECLNILAEPEFSRGRHAASLFKEAERSGVLKCLDTQRQIALSLVAATGRHEPIEFEAAQKLFQDTLSKQQSRALRSKTLPEQLKSTPFYEQILQNETKHFEEAQYFARALIEQKKYVLEYLTSGKRAS